MNGSVERDDSRISAENLQGTSVQSIRLNPLVELDSKGRIGSTILSKELRTFLGEVGSSANNDRIACKRHIVVPLPKATKVVLVGRHTELFNDIILIISLGCIRHNALLNSHRLPDNHLVLDICVEQREWNMTRVEIPVQKDTTRLVLKVLDKVDLVHVLVCTGGNVDTVDRRGRVKCLEKTSKPDTLDEAFDSLFCASNLDPSSLFLSHAGKKCLLILCILFLLFLSHRWQSKEKVSFSGDNKNLSLSIRDERHGIESISRDKMSETNALGDLVSNVGNQRVDSLCGLFRGNKHITLLLQLCKLGHEL